MSPPQMRRRIIQLAAAFALAFAAASPAAADHFGEPSTGGQEPATNEPPLPPNCDSSPCPPETGTCESGETNNSSNQCDESGSGTPDPTAGEPVDAFTGRLFLAKTDLVVNGVVPIRMVRNYDSQSRYDSPLGYGWSFHYDTRLFERPSGAVVVRGWEGRRWLYLPPDPPSTQFIEDDTDGGLVPTLAFDPVVGDAVEYVLTYDDGERALFDNEGRLYALETPEGNRLRFFYSATKMPLSGMSPYAITPTTRLTVAHVWRLTEIKEQLNSQVGSNPEEFTGRWVQLDYKDTTSDPINDPISGRLIRIRSHDGRSVDYAHQELAAHPAGGVPGFRGNLAKVTGAHTASESGIVETYRYPATPAANSTPAAFEHIHDLTYREDGASNQILETVYEADYTKDRVDTQTYGGSFWDFTYEDTPIKKTTIARTIVTPDQANKTATTVYEFNPQGFLTAKVDANGNRIEYDRPTGHQIGVVRVYEVGALPPNPPSRTVTSTYTADGRMETRSVTLPETGETVTESWVYEGRFTSLYQTVSSADPGKIFKTVTTFFYDAHGRPTNIESIQRRKGDDGSGGDAFVTTQMTYDPDHGQLATITPPSVSPADHLKIRRVYYTAADDVPGPTSLIRNGLLKRIEVIADDGSSVNVDAHLAREFDYDAAGNVAQVADAKGHVTELAWNGRSQLVRETRRIGGSSASWESTLYRYGGRNAVTGTTVPNLGTDPTLDGSIPGEHLLQVETGALGATGTATPGRVVRFVVNARGTVLSVQRKDAGGSYLLRSYHRYDSDDNRVQSSEPTATGTRTLVFSYDRMKQITKFEDGASNDTVFAYDALGNRKQATEAIAGQATQFVYDDLDRLIETRVLGTNPDEITKFRYDAAGNVIKVTDPKLQETDYNYDTLSRLLAVEQHLGQTVVYRYDDRSRLTRVVNARGQALEHGYEPWGGLAEVLHYPTETDAIAQTNLARTIAYTYDLEGNLVSASDDDDALDVTGPLFTAHPVTGYDARNRLHQHTLHYIPGGDITLTSAYNRFGERAQLDLTQGSETLTHSWAYDALGRLETASLPNSDPLSFTSNPNDRLASLERPSGVIADYAYLPEGPLDTLTVTAPGSIQLLDLDYAVNTVQNITAMAEQHASSDPTHTTTYGYDGANRLRLGDYPTAYGLPADQRYAYDAASNRDDANSSFVALGTHTYDANNRITVSPGFASHAFDADGNMTAKAGETLTWDTTNRLRSFSKTGTNAEYAYDPFGRRIVKTANGVTTWFVWSGDRLLAEYGNSGDRQVRYAYAGGFAPVQVAYANGAGEDVYDVHSDHLDTPRLLTDDAGAVAWREAHEVFGKAHLDVANSVTSFNIRFPGQYFDVESGLHYNRFRYYDPGVGRYISADPLMQIAGVNLYPYADHNPLGTIDPLGLNPAQKIVEWFAKQVGKRGALEEAIAETFEQDRDKKLDDMLSTDPTREQEINDEYDQRMRDLDALGDKSAWEKNSEDYETLKNRLEEQYGIDLDGDGFIGDPDHQYCP